MFDRIRQDYQTYRSARHRGFWALVFYRYGRWVAAMRPGPIRWALNGVYSTLSIIAPVITGVSLDRSTEIGSALHIIHPGMVLIHPRARIGHRVGVMHGITIGTSPTHPGMPTIGDDVFIGCGAVILGPVTIGDGARIAPNSLVITDVAPGATAIGVPAKVYPASTAGRAPAKAVASAAPIPNADLATPAKDGQRTDAGSTDVDLA